MVFDASNQDFRGLLEYITENDLLSTKALAQRIESYIKNGSSNVEQKNINYLRSLMHFLLDDWEAGRQRNRAHHFNKMIARRYNRTRRSAVQGNEDSLQELLPFSPDILDSEGIETDDFFPQQTFIEVNGQYIEGQNKKLIPAVERVFDRALNKKKSIDVSNKVRRGQNVCLQNTELLKSGDLARFIRFLTSDRLTGKYPAITLAFWIMWLIGKPLDEVTELYIFDNLQDTTSGMYIDPDGHGWWRFPVNYSAKPRLDDRNLGLIATSNEVLTACPSFLVSLVRKYYSGGVARLLPDSVDRELLVMHLKRFSDHQRCGSRINIEKIYSFTERFCFATGTIDPAVLDFSYQVSLSRTRVSRSYLCLDEQTRIMALHRLWSDITHYIVASDPEINCPVFFEERYWNDPRSVGSTFTPSQEALQHLVSHLSTLVNRLSPRAACPITDVIHYHNAYAVYTCFMLMFATGYRAVYNPLPSLSLSLRSYRLLGISDKDDSDFTHARLVCMPTILAKQLEYYTAHLAMLTEILRYRDPLLSTQIDQILTVDETILGLGFSDSSEWYQTIRNSRRVLGPLFHFRPVNRQWQAINLFPKAQGESVNELLN